MIPSVLFAIVSLASLAWSTPMTLLERRETPSHFNPAGTLEPSTTLTLRIALTRNLTRLEEILYEVSNPRSAKYGQYLNHEQVKSLARPDPAAVDAVSSWLLEQGANNVKTTGGYEDWVHFEVPVHTANNMLRADFKSYFHPESRTIVHRSTEFHIPTHLSQYIEMIQPITDFSSSQSTLSSIPSLVTPSNITKRAPSDCASSMDIQCFRDRYGIPSTQATQSSNKLAVVGSLDQFANLNDLEKFLKDQGLPVLMPGIVLFDGGSNPQDPEKAGAQANFDTQYAVGLAPDVSVDFISVGGNADTVLGFLDLAEALLRQETPPQVLSVGYVLREENVTRTVARRLCEAYMMLSARGTSVIYGAGEVRQTGCDKLLFNLPDVCPYVTVVGGVSGGVALDSSSGGFSDMFGRPPFQDEAVQGYLQKLGDVNKGKFNPNGRAYPDVAIESRSMHMVLRGENVLTVGASNVIFASMIATLNGRLMAAGKQPLGLLNPFLYANTQIFTDITAGSNPGDTPVGCAPAGFPAKEGWDVPTGLGEPNFPKLLEAAGL